MVDLYTCTNIAIIVVSLHVSYIHTVSVMVDLHTYIHTYIHTHTSLGTISAS